MFLKYNIKPQSFSKKTIKSRAQFCWKFKKGNVEKRLKAVDFANSTKIAPSVISRYLSGKNQPSMDNIMTIGNYLDIHPQSLLSSSDTLESIKSSQGI